MKTNPVRGEWAPQRVAAKPETAKKGAFAKVLDGKAAAEEKPPTPFPAAPPLPQLTTAAGKVESPAPVAAPREIDAVANEIAVAVRNAGNVEILFDSKTLAGLHVRISKDQNRLTVRLQAQSAEITRLMAQHSDALTQRLEARGYQTPVVQVQNAPTAVFRDRPNPRGGQGEGRREQRRERDKGTP
jgi:flagellar hook-length control protein FliK